MVLVLVATLSAQIRTGNIFGRVIDQDGNALPGVSVTLIPAAGAPMVTVTTAEGTFRFVSLSPASNYKVKAELRGFKARTEENVIVTMGVNTNIDVKMEMGVLEEQVTVTAVSPVIDKKKTAVGKNVTQEILQSLPSARDPWVVMQMAPAIIMDRENVGGNESGQQASYVGKGDPTTGSQNVWAVDGMVVTDPAAIGGSPGYWDFDSFEEMNVTTGGSDVTVQTGGIALNMVTRRGGNKVALGGRFYYTDEYFQATNLTDALIEEGVTMTNRILSIRDYGFNLGGPIIKDMAWLWGSYGVQDIYTMSILNTPIKPLLKNYNFKLNLQVIPQNRFEAFMVSGEKEFIGRSASASNPQGLHQRGGFHFGSPILKIQDEQMIGDNLLISAKFGYMNAAFQMVSMMDEDMVKWASYDEAKKLNTNSTAYYITTRPMYNLNGYVNYFNDSLFGVHHDIKLGVEYSTRRVTSDSSYSGNTQLRFDYTAPTLATTPGGAREVIPGIQKINIWMQSNLDWNVDQIAGFFSDTVTAGRLNVVFGLRYDRQTPSVNTSNYSWIQPNSPVWQDNFDSSLTSKLHTLFPDLISPNIKPDYHWNVLSPRIGVTYDLFGTGKTLFKANFAMYGDFMGTSMAGYFVPAGYPLWSGQNGYLGFWWKDSGDKKVQANELFWQYGDYYPVRAFDDAGNFVGDFDNAYGIMWYGERTGNPTALQYLVNPDAGSTRTTEFLATVEHELLPDFSLGLDFTLRKYDHQTIDLTYLPGPDANNPFVGGRDITRNDYVVAGKIPNSIAGVDLGEAAGKPWYVYNANIEYSPYAHHTTYSGYYTFWGLDFRFSKRLSNKWMVDGSFSYMDQKVHYGSEFADQTNLWALDSQVYAPNMGGASGKIGQYVFSHWMFKIEGLYQLPYGFDVSFTFNARQGHIIPHYMTISDANLPNPISQSNTIWLSTFGKDLLPTFYQLNMRFEKMIKIADTGRIYLMVDCFNVFNSAIINRREDRYEGDYYVDALSFDPNALKYLANEVLNPRVFRFGVRFQI